MTDILGECDQCGTDLTVDHNCPLAHRRPFTPEAAAILNELVKEALSRKVAA
jgi:hypothetical protein